MARLERIVRELTEAQLALSEVVDALRLRVEALAAPPVGLAPIGEAHIFPVGAPPPEPPPLPEP
jgi:hypothetical protein